MARKSVVITGVTRGMGRALAEEFAAAGHAVAGCGRSAAELATLERALGAGHVLSQVDVADDHQVAAFAREVTGALGPPDLLVNNAALINQPAPLWEVEASEMNALLAVNLGGVAAMIRHFVPAMISAGRGVVVNLSSGWGRSTSPDMAPYCTTKWGIEGMTQALAQELPAPLASVALSPGTVHTDMLEIAFGPSASASPSPAQWSRRAVPFLLGLDRSDNGASLSITGELGG